MAILLCHNLKSQLRIYRSPPQESEFWRKNNFFKLVQNLLASVPYFYQDYTCAIALPRATPTSATRTRLTSEIVRCQDDQFDNAGLGVVDCFPIRRGFAIVTYGSIWLAALPGLAEPDFDFAGYFLVLGRLVCSYQ